MSYSQKTFDRAVWAIVAKIKPGRIMSYGEVARAAGFPRHARMVSKAMGRAIEPLPWYRVVRSNHTLAFAPSSNAYQKQKALLEQEGTQVIDGKVIPFESDDDIDLDKSLWG